MLNRYSNVFRSRWKALGWSLGVLATAYCSVPSSPDKTDKQNDSAPQVAAHHASKSEIDRLRDLR